MTAATHPSTGLLARLKADTQAEHDAIEAALGLTGGTLSLAAYRRTLERFYGFYRPLEGDLLAASDLATLGLDVCERLKTPLLDADLRALAVESPEWLPISPSRPIVSDAASAFGCLYVLEGATLGGQVISRHVRQALGVTPETGGRFFHGYGYRTGAMWQSFRTALAAFATTHETQDRVADAAVQTFRTLRAWCERGEAA